MLRIIVRIAVILAVAGIIAGGIYLFVNSSVGQTVLASARGGQDGQVQIAAGFNAVGNNQAGSFSGFSIQGNPGGLSGGFGGRDFGGDQAGLASIWKNLAIITMITAAVVFFQKTIKLVFRKQPAIN
jgi:hypothetical protein